VYSNVLPEKTSFASHPPEQGCVSDTQHASDDIPDLSGTAKFLDTGKLPAWDPLHTDILNPWFPYMPTYEGRLDDDTLSQLDGWLCSAPPTGCTDDIIPSQLDDSVFQELPAKFWDDLFRTVEDDIATTAAVIQPPQKEPWLGLSSVTRTAQYVAEIQSAHSHPVNTTDAIDLPWSTPRNFPSTLTSRGDRTPSSVTYWTPKAGTPISTASTPILKAPTSKSGTPIAKPRTPIAKPHTPMAKAGTPIAKPERVVETINPALLLPIWIEV
jgi:hypothetical protein